MRTESGSDRESALRRGWTVEGRVDPAPEPELADPVPTVADANDAVVAADASDPPREHAQLSNLAVLGLGLVGGFYLLYAGIWLTWARYYSDVNAAVAAGSGSIGGALQQIVFWIAPLAPVLWFVTAVVLYRKRRLAFGLVIVLGLIVLLPLPMLFSNGAAL